MDGRKILIWAAALALLAVAIHAAPANATAVNATQTNATQIGANATQAVNATGPAANVTQLPKPRRSTSSRRRARYIWSTCPTGPTW
jgi:hypothetical protein